jgi:hypothetical protein
MQKLGCFFKRSHGQSFLPVFVPLNGEPETRLVPLSILVLAVVIKIAVSQSKLTIFQTHDPKHKKKIGIFRETVSDQVLPKISSSTSRLILSKVGLAAARAKTAAMRINLNIEGCGVVAPPVHSSLRAPHLLANLLAHNLPLPRAAH